MEEEAVNTGNRSNSPDKAEDVSASIDEASNGISVTRARCKYGESCYRRNEDHKKQFSHPGDSDYDSTPATSTTPDNRQECKYGTLCYRKNPQHWKDFKHTSVPVKKRKRKVKEVEADQDLSDDYDYDDPFINDGSSDDYQPSSSGSDHSSGDDEESEEDMKRTLREGKRFFKR